MSDPCEQPVNSVTCIVAVLLAHSILLAGCASSNPAETPPADRPILRIGISNAPSQSADRGVQQFGSNMSTEGLLRVNQEGRIEPWLAERWNRSTDGRQIVIGLRRNVRFHDGSTVDAAAVAEILKAALPKTVKSAYDDVAAISARSADQIEISLKQPSTIIEESLMDVTIVRGAIGTGPFRQPSDPSSGSVPEITSFDDYYLGRPTIQKIAFTTYPNIRAAWADMLRDRLDMLYEVGSDAIESMRGATSVSLYSFDRPYQYLLFLNTRNAKLASREVRQALNEAIDRSALVKESLAGHGTPSAGPVSSHHWAFRGADATFRYAPDAAAAKIRKPLSLRCVTLAEAPFEQIALTLKRQLKAVNVDLQIEAAGVEQVFSAMTSPDFEAVLLDGISGWSLARASRWWHSKGTSNVTHFSSAEVDAALDQVQHAVNDDEYRAAVAAFQKAMEDDPPAVFLAWSKRSRAVSRKFDVQPEQGRDILATLRLWRPSADYRKATTN